MTRPKLLLADDSVTIRKVIELTFAGEGIDVTAVTDAAAAMSKFVEIQPDIVLVDIDLDGTSGYHICEMIKQDEATKHIPVLLLVGSFEPFDQTEAERVQADGFLTKPFQSIRDLVAQVWQLLGREAEEEFPVDIEEDLSGFQTLSTIESAQSAGEEVAETIEPEIFNEAPPAGPETADIDDLYNNSFAITSEMEEYDTVDDLLGDSGMDDEMIEASYPSSSLDEPVSDLKIPADVDVEQTKQFDWSPESVVSENPVEMVTEPPPDPIQSEEIESFTEEASSVEYVEDSGFVNDGEEDFVEDTTGGPAELDESGLDGDSSSSAVGFEMTDSPSDAEDNGNIKEPSAELITLIAQRVVERLSDNVIREIARESVPRIAEKLIREALEEDSKA
ncbi:MAG: response regulator [Pyrinomonadaceae bacterium]